MSTMELISNAKKGFSWQDVFFSNAEIGLALTSEVGEIIHINGFAESLFGFAVNELVGEMISSVIADDLLGNIGQHSFSHPGSFLTEEHEFTGKKKDGSIFPIEVSLHRFISEGENFLMVFIVDITQEKHFEQLVLSQDEELNRIKTEMRQMKLDLEEKVHERTLFLLEALLALEKSNNELQAVYAKEKQESELKARFVSKASLECSTPLNTFLSSVYLVRKYSISEDTESCERHIEKIIRPENDLSYILDDFLFPAKPEEEDVEIHFQTISSEIILDDIRVILEELSQSSDKEQVLNLCHSLNVNSLVVDRKVFRNILISLVSNAINCSPKQSIITIHCSNEPGNLKFSVSDQNMGITEAGHGRLFKQFFYASNIRNINGTGLGLHIVRRYIDLMGATITLISKLNAGTTVTILIPQFRENAL